MLVCKVPSFSLYVCDDLTEMRDKCRGTTVHTYLHLRDLSVGFLWFLMIAGQDLFFVIFSEKCDK